MKRDDGGNDADLRERERGGGRKGGKRERGGGRDEGREEEKERKLSDGGSEIVAFLILFFCLHIAYFRYKRVREPSKMCSRGQGQRSAAG